MTSEGFVVRGKPATRMLWFLRPEAFLWEKGYGMVLQISEMTKKFEHKGVNNRLLREMRRVEVTGQREYPCNCDLKLWGEAELLKLREKLLRLLRDPGRFIARVFRSEDEIWVERCSEMIKERRV
jgi:hypothetical protein